MRRILSLIGLFGFISSMLVHGATYLGIHAGRTVPSIWLLHVGAIDLCFPMVFSVRRLKVINRKEFWGRFFAPMPMWVRPLVHILLIYTFINFALFFFSSHESVVIKRDNGEYGFNTVVNDEVQFIPATEDEYYDYETTVLRGFSGHWMIFYLLPTVYFWFPRTGEFSQGLDRGLVEKPQDNPPTFW